MEERDMHVIIPKLKDYAWGSNKGEGSHVEKIYQALGSAVLLDGTVPPSKYAEIWVGQHVSGMADVVLPDGVKKPIDTYVKEKGLKEPSFLLKILSVNAALSLQIHPSKEAAVKLHEQHPEIYKDANHKPEIAIAISEEFHALAGFRPIAQIIAIMKALPALRTIFFRDMELPGDAETFLRTAFGNLLGQSDGGVEVDRFLTAVDGGSVVLNCMYTNEALEVLREVRKDHSGPSLCAVFLIQKITLKRGEALFLGASVIHAYLKGDCVECMATSDNVIRGGLTPKLIDVPVLMEHLLFIEGGAVRIEPERQGTMLVYIPPVKDFKVTRITVEKEVEVNCNDLICGDVGMGIALSGDGKISSASEGVTLKEGSCFLISKGQDIIGKRLKIEKLPSSSKSSLELWSASSNICE